MAAEEEHNEGPSPSDNPTKVDRSLDELARDLATSNVSRGRVLKIMGGALLGSVLAAVPGVAWADDDDCKRRGRRCTRNRQCCSKNCINNPTGSGKVCGCPTGKTTCQGRCVTNCTSPKVLDTTTCQCVCPTVACEGGMVNSTTCECECQPPKTPVDGQCVCPGGCEGGTVNPNTCQCECPSGQVACNGACVSNQCGPDQRFNSTTCQCQCLDTTLVICNGQCVSNQCPPDATFNPTTCRCECDTACPPGTVPECGTCRCQSTTTCPPDVASRCEATPGQVCCPNVETVAGEQCIFSYSCVPEGTTCPV